MCWFAESRTEINYVLLHHDWRNNVRTESDHSSCLRRFTCSSARKKLKLSLNPKALSSNGSIPRATEVTRSSADLLSSAKKPQPFTRPDPTSPAQNNNPQACPQANPSEKSVSNSQPSLSTGPPAPAPAPASTQPTSQGTIVYDSSHTDSADSVPLPNCEGMTRF